MKWTYEIFAHCCPCLELVVELRFLCLCSTQNRVWILKNGVCWLLSSFSSAPASCRSPPALDLCSNLLTLPAIYIYSHLSFFSCLFQFQSLLHRWNYSAAKVSPLCEAFPPICIPQWTLFPLFTPYYSPVPNQSTVDLLAPWFFSPMHGLWIFTFLASGPPIRNSVNMCENMNWVNKAEFFLREGSQLWV